MFSFIKLHGIGHSILWLFFLLGVVYILQKLISEKPNKIKFHFKFFLFYFWCILLALLTFPIYLLRPKNTRNTRLATMTMRPITHVLNIRWEFRNVHSSLAKDQGAVIVANHQSSLDALGMACIWHNINNASPVVKKTLFYVWPFGLTCYLCGVVFIDKTNTREAYKELDSTKELLVKKKTKLWLFPEGTRNVNSTKLKPFKKGAFALAIDAQVPVIPIVFSPYYFVNEEKFIFDKGHVIIKCLDPVPTAGLTKDDLQKLMDHVHELMQTEFDKISKEVLDALPFNYPLPTYLKK